MPPATARRGPTASLSTTGAEEPVLTEEAFRQLVGRIRRHWGAHLEVTIVADGTPSMDWGTVFLPQEMLLASRSEAAQRRQDVEAVLWHEFAHRTVAPGTPVAYTLWRLLARQAGARADDELVNLLADLVVDDELANRASPTKGFYAAAERRTLAELARAAQQIDGGTKPKSGVFGRLRRSLATPVALEGVRTLIGQRVGLVQAAYAQVLGDPAPEGLQSSIVVAATRAVSALRDTDRPMLERVRQASTLLAPYHRVRLRSSGYGWFFRTLGDVSAQAGDDELVRAIVGDQLGAELRLSDYEGVLGSVRALRIYGRVREKLYARITCAVDRLLAARRRARVSVDGLGLWRPGEDVHRLDFPASVSRSGPLPLIPSVNTLRRRVRMGAEVEAPRRAAASVVLLIDDSGSMYGNPIDRAAEAAMAVLRQAETRGDRVGLIVFGSGVTGRVNPGQRYAVVRGTVCRLHGASGGTVITEALELALQWSGELRRRGAEQSTIAFTDTWVADEEEALSRMERLARCGRMTLFEIGAWDSRGEFLELAWRRGVRIIPVAPDRPVWKQAREEARPRAKDGRPAAAGRAG